MGFLGIYRAIYDYVPQAESELPITEGDLLFVLEKNSDDDWWKAKKKASADDEEEPVGIIPNNYVEEAGALGTARALYEYTRQTDEELSFPEDATLNVFDTSDPDWILVGLDGEFGFVPSNYIELLDPATEEESPAPPVLPQRHTPSTSDPELSSDASLQAATATPLARDSPAAALAGVIRGHPSSQTTPSPSLPPRPAEVNTPDASDEEESRNPALPRRHISTSASFEPEPIHSPDFTSSDLGNETLPTPHRTPGGFHMYNINEMVSVMGKRKKMPTTLGINLGTGTILIAPEKAQDGPSQEWTADRMTHYSREGKHVFLELVRPTKSVDFHAGAKDTAEEIVSALGELAGAVRAEGLREVIMAGSGQSQKRGQILYDFMAQGEDEVTVAVGDEIIVLDDTKSEEWWQVRRLKNGREGVVPSSYIEVTGTVSPPPSSAGLNSAKSNVEQNRLEEIRLTKEAVKAAHSQDSTQQVGPGMPLPERGSSLLARENGSNPTQQRSKRETGRGDGSHQPRSSKSKPDPSKVRTWTDRSKSFSVEAQFLGLKDGKLNLHKMNGVKIAVPVAKMSVEDLEYVERMTGISLDEDKPLSNVKKLRATPEHRKASGLSNQLAAGASVRQPQGSEYDWFQFFLSCDVNVGLCERYAQAFAKDSMDESVLPDVDAAVLRTLGLREGDILKVMRTLDAKFNRTGSRSKRGVSFAGEHDGGGSDGDGTASGGGLFSGPGGALRNNTRKTRPAPAIQTSDVVDPKAFARAENKQSSAGDADLSQVAAPTPLESTVKKSSGFDDDAWELKPAKESLRPDVTGPAESAPATKPSQPLSSSLQELSLLTAPLEPSKPQQLQEKTSEITPSSSIPSTQISAPANQPPGATAAFFAAMGPNHLSSSGNTHPTQQSSLRQRPMAPPSASSQGALMPPPPPRPLSAPQSAQSSAFSPPPLLPQMTGVSGHTVYQSQVAPPGQSLGEINQARLQQQFAQQMQQQMQVASMNMYPLQNQGSGVLGFGAGNQPPSNHFIQPVMTGAPAGHGQLLDPIRSTQFSPMQPQVPAFPAPYPQAQSFTPIPAGNINSFLPPALEPQRTGVPGFQAPPSGPSGFSALGGVTPMPALPLQPQKTGPPPPVRFGVAGDNKKLTPQATGRRANLSQATPQNPFGF